MATVTLLDGLVSGEWPNHVSSSQRSSWTDCRLRTALRVAGRLRRRRNAVGTKGLTVGTLVHAVLGQHYRTPPADRSPDRLKAWLEARISLGEHDDDSLLQSVKPRALAMLDRFWRKYGGDCIVPLEIEAPIRRRLPSGVDYMGFADMGYERDGIIVVEDFKTSLATIDPTKHTVFNPQGRDYLWGLSDRYPVNEMVMSWLLLTPSSARRIDTPFGELGSIEQELDAVAVEERFLAPLPSYDAHCMWCDFRPLCEAKLTGGRVADVLRDQYEQMPMERETAETESEEAS